METKTSKAIRLYQEGEYKAAFKLFSGFKIGFNADERRSIQITHECLEDDSRRKFYKSIGVDWSQEVANAVNTMKRKYNLQE